MVLDEYRETADTYLNPIARYFVEVHPNTMTWAALVCSVLALVCFVLTNPWFFGESSKYFLLVASMFIGLNALFDLLDGKVARLRKIESKRGDFLDHVLDRYADVFIIGGIMLSPYCDYRIGLFAMLGVIFTSYMGTQAQAVGIKRHYGGLLGRADRLALLIIFPFFQLIFIEQTWVFMEVTFIGYPFQLNLMDGLMIWFGIGGNITAIQRGYETWEELTKKEKEEKSASNPGSEEKEDAGARKVKVKKKTDGKKESKKKEGK